MFQAIRYNAFYRCFAAFMALYLLNISADPVDNKPLAVAENLSLNRQESFLELLIEKLLGYDDAIDEYDDSDSEDGFSVKKNLSVDLYILPVAKTADKSCAFAVRKPLCAVIAPDFKSPAAEIHSPPPEA
jgi:hypothetical protein